MCGSHMFPFFFLLFFAQPNYGKSLFPLTFFSFPFSPPTFFYSKQQWARVWTPSHDPLSFLFNSTFCVLLFSVIIILFYLWLKCWCILFRGSAPFSSFLVRVVLIYFRYSTCLCLFIKVVLFFKKSSKKKFSPTSELVFHRFAGFSTSFPLGC